MAQRRAIAAHDRLHWRSVAAMTLLVAASGCSYQSFGSIDQHYRAFAVRTPENSKVFVCSAYGCRTQTGFKFTPTDIAQLRSLMAESTKVGGPVEERQSIARTLAWMEKRVGDVVGTSADRPGDDLLGMGDPTQMDCVDVATNLTSYLLVLERNNLLKHHTVGAVFVKEDLRRGWSGWPHYAAIVVENQSRQRYAVDGWKLASGKEPEIIEAEKWYIDDADIAVKAML
jgi:hypothetical protein